jgi:hypothetical protein
VIGAAAGGHDAVEFVFRAAFEIAQVLGIGRDAAFGERLVDALAIRKEQRVADVEEDGCNFVIGHCVVIFVERVS